MIEIVELLDTKDLEEQQNRTTIISKAIHQSLQKKQSDFQSNPPEKVVPADPRMLHGIEETKEESDSDLDETNDYRGQTIIVS